MMKNDWGFTNDDAEYEEVIQFKKAAIADGWIPRPTYQNSNVDSIDTACSLTKDDYKMSVISRVKEKPRKWKYEANVAIWGPDTLSISVPHIYSMKAIEKGLRICGWCGKPNVDTQRVAFCNRVCKACRSAAQEKLEFPGWCN